MSPTQESRWGLSHANNHSATDGDLTFSALSVRCRLLNRVDHEQFDRAPRRFELQPELFLKGGKDRGIVGQVRRCAKRREHQRESEHAREAGLVDDWPINTGVGTY